MHIKNCSVKAFGHFKDVSFEDLSSRIVVLLGPNEAGKSTFFEFLQTMLYGIYPTNPEKHRYAPRDGQALEGSATIILRNDRTIEVSRRLARVPQGHMANGTEEDLRNKAIPGADFISGKVFDAIYALDLHDMTGLQGRAWAEVQDRLLGGMNLDFLRSARNVIEEVEREANELWRPDRRGRPVERRLRDERDGLAARLGAARDREVELQAIAAEIGEGETRLAHIRQELPRLQAEARRLDRIGPIALRWRKIQALRKTADGIESYRHVPENPAAILKEWHRRDDEYKLRLDDIEEQIEQSEHDQHAVDDSDRLLVRLGEEIRGWSKRAGSHETNLGSLRSLGVQIAELRIAATREASRLAGPAESETLIRGVADWDAEEYSSKIEQLEDAAERLASLKTRESELHRDLAARKPFLPVIALAAGAVLVGAGIIQAIPPAWMAGALIALAGIVWLAFELAKSSSLRSEKDRLSLPKAEAEYKSFKDDIRAGFEVLGAKVTEGWREKDLLDALVRIRGLVRQRLHLVNQSRALTAMLDADRSAILQLAKACGGRLDLDVVDAVAHLQGRLEEAVERVRRAQTAEQRLFRLNHDRERLIADRQALVDQIVQVEATLGDLGDGSIEAGVEALTRRRRAKLTADHDGTSLDKDHPGWRDSVDELEALTEADMELFTDAARQAREDELERLRRDLNYESVKVARKRNELNILLKNETPDEVESRIETIDEQLRLVRSKRDRLVLFANILRTADQQFRFKHQPDVIRKASEYLEKITAGRYKRMILEDEEQKLLVFERGSGLPIEVDESLSQGTRDQVYLSIRFALMDHLDAHQERLPACLDEVFVNWDQDRRRLGYEILKDLAERRQVFVFTCHPWMADELEAVVTAQRIEL